MGRRYGPASDPPNFTPREREAARDADWHRPHCPHCGATLLGPTCGACEPGEEGETLVAYIRRRWREGEYADG